MINDKLALLVNESLEREVIGSIINYPNLYEECLIKSSDIHNEYYRNILSVIEFLNKKNEKIDVMSIVDVASRTGKIEKIGGLKLVTEISSEQFTPASFSKNQKMLLENKRKHETLITMSKKMNELLESDLSTFQESLFQDLNKITDSSVSDDDKGDIKEALKEVIEDMQTERNGTTGASSGFIMLDEYIDGFKREKLVIIGARPGAGKTAIALNMVKTHSIDNNLPSVVFNMEMSKTELIKRMISNIGNIQSELMRNPMKTFKEKHWNDTMNSVGVLGSSKMRIFDNPTIDLAYIKQKCRSVSREFPGEHMIVFIDYLQLIKGDPKLEANKNLQIGEISKALKVLARELKCTVVCLSQLGRNVEQRQDKRPIMSDIRDSGQVEQDADIIGMLYRDDYYNPDSQEKNVIELIICKNREGRNGTIKLAFHKEYGKITNKASF